MNIKEIKEMINLMNDNGLMELEVEKEGMRIRLKKAVSGAEGFGAPIVIEREKIPQAAVKESLEAKAKAGEKTLEIKAPMVGTFYHSPSPEAPAYVEAGQAVEIGQVICIIEAMKLMTEIKSEIKGKVLEVLVDNAEPVEFAQPLFLIEPL
ncbi:MAG: acetyl-CoA carboxylase biotin carboxyl carrier protein [Candidatus Omnitrophota bacterium]